MAKRSHYAQFCPVAQGAEVFAERWTPLIVRELLMGSTRFNELRRGLPLVSPSLLSGRLSTLQDAGVVERVEAGKHAEYHLTEAGRALQPLVEALGTWAHQHLRRELLDEELDPEFLMWDIRRTIDPGEMAGDRAVIQFDLEGVPRKKGRWWLLVDRGEVDLCLKAPGPDVDLYVTAPIRRLVEVWLGETPLRQALREGDIQLDGDRRLARGFPSWLGVSRFAALAKG